MIKWKVELICTAYKPQQFPMSELPEIAIAGRSNVGKSSLLNKLAGQKLAHVSASPGRTRSVNFFKVEAPHSFTLVDLPGFGYATRSKAERNEWGKLINLYIEKREELALVLHLVDIRHGLMSKDRELQEWLRDLGVPMLVVFTKSDKIAKSKRKALIQKYIDDRLYSWTLPLACSIEEPQTIDALKVQIDQYLDSVLKTE